MFRPCLELFDETTIACASRAATPPTGPMADSSRLPPSENKGLFHEMANIRRVVGPYFFRYFSKNKDFGK